MDEKYYLENAYLAYKFKDEIVDRRARGALLCAHHVLLECFVAPLHYLAQRIRPEKPIDTLIFFKGVAETFSTWNEASNQDELVFTENPQVINRPRAFQFVTSLRPARASAILLHFMQIVTKIAIPAGRSIDLDFCCRIVGAFVVRDDVLNNILSGAIANDLDEYDADPELWQANAWFT